MSELLPLIVREVLGQPGVGEAQRLPADLRQAFAQGILGWLGQHSVLARVDGAATSITLGPSEVLGRTSSGPIGPIGRAGLEAILDLGTQLAQRAPAVHGHDFRNAISGIDWATLDDDRILASVGGQFVWIPIPTGGSGGFDGTLEDDLDLADFRVVDGAVEVLRVVDGKVYLAGQEVLASNVDAPLEGHVTVWNPVTQRFENRYLAAAFVLYDREGGGQNSLQDMIDAILAALGNKANTDHTHALEDIQGGTAGRLASFDGSGALSDVDTGVEYDGTNLLLRNLPKTDPQVVDALWSDNGTLRVSAGVV